jgi:anti-sigma B factor antagonist
MTRETPEPSATAGVSRVAPITISVAGDGPDGARMLAVGGEIDLAGIDALREAISTAIERDGVRRLTVDLGAVTFLDSSGIGTLVFGRNVAVRNGAVLSVVNATGMVRTVLELTGVLAILSPHGTSHVDGASHLDGKSQPDGKSQLRKSQLDGNFHPDGNSHLDGGRPPPD